MNRALIVISFMLMFSIPALSHASYSGHLQRAYYTYYGANSTSSFSLGVYYNVSGPSILTIIPASEFSQYENGGSYQTIYNQTVYSSGIGIYNLSAGMYEVILYAQNEPINYNFYVVQGHSLRIYKTSAAFNYTLSLSNYSLINVSYLSTSPVRVSSAGQFIGVGQNYGGFFAYANMGLYNATITPSGPATTYVFGSVTPELVNPLNFTHHGPSIGLAYYGFKASNSETTPNPVRTGTLAGYAIIRSINAYNASPPVNSSQYGASLQMNSMLYIDSPYGNSTFWLQNVLSLNTSSGTYSMNDNIWNASSEYANVSRSEVSGSGSFLSFAALPGKLQRIYAYQAQSRNYALPINLTLVTNVTYSNGFPIVHFGYYRHGILRYYDNITIKIPSKSAYMLSTPYYEAPNGNTYDFELVFGGSSNGEVSQFSSMNASIMLYYSDKGNLTALPLYLSFGSDTAEGASNLATEPSSNGALVILGQDNYSEYILPSKIQVVPVNTTTVTTTGSTTVPSTSTIPPVTTTIPTTPQLPTSYISSTYIAELIEVLIVLVIVLLAIGIAAHKRANRQ